MSTNKDITNEVKKSFSTTSVSDLTKVGLKIIVKSLNYINKFNAQLDEFCHNSDLRINYEDYIIVVGRVMSVYKYQYRSPCGDSIGVLEFLNSKIEQLGGKKAI